MATVLYELLSSSNRTLVYSVLNVQRQYIFRFDLSTVKGRDSRVYMQGDDKRWVLMLEDNFYERQDNTPNKIQQKKIMDGEMTKEQVEQYNESQRLQRRNEKLGFYFNCLNKLLL